MLSLRSRYHEPVRGSRDDGTELVREALGTHGVVAGLDEVGRGALAGPVVVGISSVVTWTSPPPGLTDSKLLSARQRESLCGPLSHWVHEWALGAASAREIDEVGLRAALALASSRALRRLKSPPELVFIDGPLDLLAGSPLPPEQTPEIRCVVGGDRTVPVISAASILAKVVRDAAMVELGRAFPNFHWARNRGYGTAHHRAVLRAEGPSPFHRRSWNLGGIEAPRLDLGSTEEFAGDQ